MSGDEESAEWYEQKREDGTTMKVPVKYLQNGNQVMLKKGMVTFGSWSNKENNEAFDNAGKELPNTNLKDKLNQARFVNAVGEWQLSYSLTHGSGFISKLNVYDVRNSLNDSSMIDIFELEKLKKAFDEYVMWQRGDVKKKVETQSTQK